MPTDFKAESAWDVQSLLAIYGIGFFVLAGVLSALFYRALLSAKELVLDEEEILITKSGVGSWLLQSMIGLVSALWALLLPEQIGVMAGFVYFLIPFAVTANGIYYGRKLRTLRTIECDSDDQ